jgi:hypothetical protein
MQQSRIRYSFFPCHAIWLACYLGIGSAESSNLCLQNSHIFIPPATELCNTLGRSERLIGRVLLYLSIVHHLTVFPTGPADPRLICLDGIALNRCKQVFINLTRIAPAAFNNASESWVKFPGRNKSAPFNMQQASISFSFILYHAIRLARYLGSASEQSSNLYLQNSQHFHYSKPCLIDFELPSKSWM